MMELDFCFFGDVGLGRVGSRVGSGKGRVGSSRVARVNHDVCVFFFAHGFVFGTWVVGLLALDGKKS